MADAARPCPHCQTHIAVCACGEWGCSFHTHIGHDCPSAEGISYRRKQEFHALLRVARGDERAQERLLTEFRDLAEEWVAKMKAARSA